MHHDPSNTASTAPATGALTADTDALRRDAWRHVRPAGPVVPLPAALHGWDAGSDAAGAAIDEGAGVLLAIDVEPPGATARAITALYCGVDASTVTPTLGDDLAWMRTCSTVRDAMARLRPVLGEPATLLADDPRLAALTAAVVRAAARRTPVVLAGASALIAALCAQRVTAGSVAWVFVAVTADDPAADLALKRLGARPWCTLDWTATTETLSSVARILVADLDGDDSPGGE